LLPEFRPAQPLAQALLASLRLTAQTLAAQLDQALEGPVAY
jgi:hypothetical protein